MESYMDAFFSLSAFDNGFPIEGVEFAIYKSGATTLDEGGKILPDKSKLKLPITLVTNHLGIACFITTQMGSYFAKPISTHKGFVFCQELIYLGTFDGTASVNGSRLWVLNPKEHQPSCF